MIATVHSMLSSNTTFYDRCFPHIVNLAVKAILEALPQSAAEYRKAQTQAGRSIEPEQEEYLQALESQPVQRCRDCVVALRHGSQCRTGLHRTIEDGNKMNHFKVYKYKSEDSRERVEVPIKLKVVELLLDCVTRWGSTRNMIERFIYLYPISADS
jgi:hypothetical protein